jgi:pimeloyl-ACP methyl ester carboxylesterase
LNGNVYPAWIEGPTGKLFAMVHEPKPAVDNGEIIIMPSAGQDSRVGPQRIYYKAARRFAAEGFRVIRLDLAGVGDSVAKGPKIHLDSHSTKDVDAGVRWAKQRWRVDGVYLVALCAGARVSMRYAAHAGSVRGVVAWSVPTLSEGDQPYLNVQGAKKALLSKKLLTAAWWKNRWKYGLKEIGEVLSSLIARIADALGVSREPYAVRCIDKYLKDDRPIQFIFGSLDAILCEEFVERFPEVPESRQAAQGYWIIPDAVHSLSTLDAHEAAIEMSANWLAERIRTTATRNAAADRSSAGRLAVSSDTPVAT